MIVILWFIAGINLVLGFKGIPVIEWHYVVPGMLCLIAGFFGE